MLIPQYLFSSHAINYCQARVARSIYCNIKLSRRKCCGSVLKKQAIIEIAAKYQELEAMQRASRARETISKQGLLRLLS